MGMSSWYGLAQIVQPKTLVLGGIAVTAVSIAQDVQFEQPIKEDVLQNAEEIERAKSGPDRYCAYCGQRNPGTAETCGICGADLSEGTDRNHGQTYHVGTNQTEETTRCSVCGTENPVERLSCQSCGSPLNTSQIIAAPTAGEESGGKIPPKKRDLAV